MFTYVTLPPRGAAVQPEHRRARLAVRRAIWSARSVTPFAGRWIDRYGHRAGIALGDGDRRRRRAADAGCRGCRRSSPGWRCARPASSSRRRRPSSYIGAVTTQRSRARGRAVFDVLLRGRQRRRRAAVGRSGCRGGWPACVALIVVVQLHGRRDRVHAVVGRPARQTRACQSGHVDALSQTATQQSG